MTRALRLALLAAALPAAASGAVLSGEAAFGDWRTDAPGVVRRISPDALPAPLATPAKAALASLAPRPEGVAPKAPPGYTVSVFARLKGPRLLRTAPNGDVFVAETSAGRITVLRSGPAGAPPTASAFAENLDGPFGVAFYPARDPQWVYVANNNAVVRFPYRSGDLKPRGTAETVIAKLSETHGGHTTRDVAFSLDGRRMFVSVGSGSNIAEEVPARDPAEVDAFVRSHPLGEMWGQEERRADVLVADPDGKNLRVFAAGIRNCVGLAVHPQKGELWCSVNERDLLGDDLPPDYVSTVREGAFYGWPWYYIGAHEDPRPNLKGRRPDLRDKVTTPDVLIQPHSAPLEMTFYGATSGASAFPAADRGQAFVALHGSWNRAKRTGYKVVKVILRDGRPTGEYEDFLTGFVLDDQHVFGRPTGVTVAADGALLVSDDAGGVVWRVSYGKAS